MSWHSNLSYQSVFNLNSLDPNSIINHNMNKFMKEVNKQSSPTGISRREFLGMAATGAAALTILPSFTVAGLGHVAPSDKLYIAKIGCGGMGAADLGSLMNTPHKNAAITCLCDVDDRQSVDARKTYPKAKYFNDFREMYEKEGKNFDAVCISTPDHNHAIQAFGAMRMGKHVYLQKPEGILLDQPSCMAARYSLAEPEA